MFSANVRNSTPKYLKQINSMVAMKLKNVKETCSEVLETRQKYHDQVLEINQDAFSDLIEYSVTYSSTLDSIKRAYDSALQVRNERISQFITQERVFGVSARRQRRDAKIAALVKETEDLKEQNLNLTLQTIKLKKEIGKLKGEQFSEYLSLARERDARYTLYFENLALQLRLRELDGGGAPPADANADPVVLRLALDRCREQLSSVQRDQWRMTEQYAETVPRREFDELENKWSELTEETGRLQAELVALQDKHKRTLGKQLAVMVPRRKFDELENKWSELTEETGRLQAELVALQDKHKRTLGKQLAVMVPRREFDELENRWSELTEETGRLQGELVALQDKHKRTLGKQLAVMVPRREFDELENKWSELTEETGRLQAELVALQDKHKRTLGKQLAVMVPRREFDELENRWSELTEETGRLQGELVALQDKHKRTLGKQLAVMVPRREFDELENKWSELTEETGRLQGELVALQDKHKRTLGKQLAVMVPRREFEELENKWSELTEETGRLQGELVALQDKHKRTLGKQLAVMVPRREFEELENKWSELTEETGRLQGELVALQDKHKRTLGKQLAVMVPRREFEELENKWSELTEETGRLQGELVALQDKHKRTIASKKGVEEELAEVKERCRELERAGTPRPQWELCADFISGGRDRSGVRDAAVVKVQEWLHRNLYRSKPQKDRWWQLASGLSSRDILMVLLKELGPAAESDHLEYFDGLGSDPLIPPYLRYAGRVRNLRLSRRELSVLVTDVWRGKRRDGAGLSMQDYVTKYFEDRYQQPSLRAEWAYNLCAGGEQMLDEPQVKLFWGVLHGQLSEDIYWGLHAQWQALRDQLYRLSKDGETISIEEFEKVAKATFPLKSELDIHNLCDVVRKQLKLKLTSSEVNLDKLFQENEEGFDRVEFARELFRQRQLAQDKYLREVLAELGGRGRGARAVTVDGLKRAFAIVDPAIDHIRMERNIRWAFSEPVSDLGSISPLPLRAVAARLAAGDIERVGPRHRGSHRRTNYK